VLFEQLVASMTAASIEAAEQPDAVIDVELEGVLGALRLHDAIIAARGAGAADPALAELDRAREDGSLRQRIRELSESCRQAAAEPDMGLIITNDDGRSVWPPSGPSCDRLVRCCEQRGLVRNGVAVGPQGLSCMLAATASTDCRLGLSMLSEQGIDCAAAP
jgi:hypothetical protein